MEGYILIFIAVLLPRGLTRAYPCTVSYEQLYDGMLASCRGRNLSSVPEDLPEDIKALDLSDNLITTLPGNAYGKFKNLTFLNLSCNSINKIRSVALKGLFQLRALYLARNQLSDNNESFPGDLFQDLHNLQILNIDQNMLTSYPDWVFPPLTNLRELYIDSLPEPFFGRGFLPLTNLRRLQMDSRSLPDGVCNVKKLTNNTFHNLRNSHLGTLVLNSCTHLQYCEYGVFASLVYLERLEFSHNRVGIPTVLNLFYPFIGRNMTTVFLRNVYDDRGTQSSVLGGIVTKESLQYLKMICISELSMSQNNIIWIEALSLIGSCLSECLESLDFSRNRLTGDGRIFFFMSLFPKLSKLQFGLQKTTYSAPPLTKLSKLQFGLQKTTYSAPPLTRRYMPDLKDGILTLRISFPQNLTYIDVTGMYEGNFDAPFQIILSNSSKVRTCITAYNNLNFLLKVKGFEQVTKLDLSGNIFNNVTEMLSSFPNVKHLKMRNCEIQVLATNMFQEVSNIFENLREITFLDLSYNGLRSIPHFPNSPGLTALNLSHNVLQNIVMTGSSITLLDVSNNLIGQLDRAVRNALDEAHFDYGLRLAVQGNPFLCGCNNLDFVLWLVDSPAIYESNRNFTCVQEDGSLTGIKYVAWNYVSKQRHCDGRFNLSVTATLLAMLMTVLVTVYFIGRNEARFMKTVFSIFGMRAKYLTQTDFVYTVYVGYCETEIPFVYRMLRPNLERQKTRLFLKDRDLLPGVDISIGIVEGINNSWKTLFVVSRDFLNDPWSNFTINTAVCSVMDLIPDRIIVLLVEDVEVDDLPESLLNAVEEDSILHVGEFREHPGRLWRKIQEIGKF